MDWSKLPDLMTVGLLAWAFAAVARRGHTPISAHWLTGWLLIALHFLAFMFIPLPGNRGILAATLGVLGLVWAAILFMRASVPYKDEPSSLAMLLMMLGTYTIYVSVLMFSGPMWLLDVSAILLAGGPFLVAVLAFRRFTHFLRWFLAGLQCALTGFLLYVRHRPDASDLSISAVLFAVYLGTSIHFCYMYRRASTGVIITITGFFLWASVFVVAPLMVAYLPAIHVENEVWNLPKYIVAVGMILILLEDQIAHNKHLALHDELTGLPNRRLFQDRLSTAIERARRTGSQAALLMVDLNQFKQVNDMLGHHTGDLLLQHVARVFSSRVRRSDTVARTGGDEFAVILDGPTSKAEAATVGRSLIDLLNEPLKIKERDVRVGASIGVALFPTDGEDCESLCIAADLRMYDDKRGDAAVPTVQHEMAKPRQTGMTMML